ncbi:MAG TPA: ribosomal-processing cysteine protease Prp [Candidatus Faecisoma merdavium]|nr:ribosomal-processing cysteine protease Prp [Candidatus Faecisoma merdavium]
MIKVSIKQKQIIIKGHANYDELGKDIVCASVSSMVITTVNAILRIDNDAIKYSDNNGVTIDIIKDDEITNKLINNLIDLLEELEKQYPKYIEIRRC